MSESVVLNFDSSIELAEEYWSSLRTASCPVISSVETWPNSTPGKSLVYPLSYYKRDLLRDVQFHNLREALMELDGSLTNNVYDFHVVNKIISSGIPLPKEAALATYEVDQKLLIESLELIEVAWPAAYTELLKYVTGFIVLGDNNIRSMTGPMWFGAVFLGPLLFSRNRIEDMATSILHEVGHLVLYAESAVNPPIENIAEVVYSPFVKRDRPALMVFHAQIAMARMILWLFNLKQFALTNTQALKFLDKINIPRIEDSIKAYGSCYLKAMENVRLIRLTDTGMKFLRDFEAIESILKKLL